MIMNKNITSVVVTVDDCWGHTIHKAIDDAISYASHCELPKVTTVVFNFNGVQVKVTKDSVDSLILRDWDRGMDGYLGKNPVVGPDCALELTAEELANDARIKIEKDKERAILEEKYRAEQKAKKDAFLEMMSVAPEFECTDLEGWNKCKENNQDPYGARTVQFAEDWVRLMQLEIDKGKDLASIAGSCCQVADHDGITGFMYGCAVNILTQCWVHGELLRVWHNKEYGVESDGVVNPAILTLK